MCRWFAYISATEPCLLEDVLITPAHSLTKQVHDHYLPYLFHQDRSSPEFTTKQEIATRNRLFNTDGFGMVWYSPIRSKYENPGDGSTNGLVEMPVAFKTTMPPNNNANLKSLAANISSKCVLGHIRMATSVVTEFNNHPFVFGKHSIMHNGYVADYEKIKRQLSLLMDLPASEHINGTTDSEAIAGLYMTFLTASMRAAVEDASSTAANPWLVSYSVKEMKAALEKTVEAILSTQQKYAPDSGANDLNVAVTDGTKLVAFRLRNDKTEQPPSLYWSNKAGATLNRKYVGHPDHEVSEKDGNKGRLKAEKHGKHVCVCSEPTTFDAKEWNFIPKNKAVLVENGELVVEDINVAFLNTQDGVDLGSERR